MTIKSPGESTTRCISKNETYRRLRSHPRNTSHLSVQTFFAEFTRGVRVDWLIPVTYHHTGEHGHVTMSNGPNNVVYQALEPHRLPEMINLMREQDWNVDTSDYKLRCETYGYDSYDVAYDERDVLICKIPRLLLQVSIHTKTSRFFSDTEISEPKYQNTIHLKNTPIFRWRTTFLTY